MFVWVFVLAILSILHTSHKKIYMGSMTRHCSASILFCFALDFFGVNLVLTTVSETGTINIVPEFNSFSIPVTRSVTRWGGAVSSV